jgi:PRTRC genetic system protein C
MPLIVEALPRVFLYNAIALDDPDPKMTPEAAKEFWANVYPELTQSQIEGPYNENERIVYKFVRTVGTKGRISVMDLARAEPDPAVQDCPDDYTLIGKFVRIISHSSGGEAVLPPSEVLEPVP